MAKEKTADTVSAAAVIRRATGCPKAESERIAEGLTPADRGKVAGLPSRKTGPPIDQALRSILDAQAAKEATKAADDTKPAE